MKKVLLFAAAALMSTAMFAEPKVATFENEEGGVNVAKADTCWQGADAPVIGRNLWESGDFTFASFTNDWGAWGVGYNGFTVTNETSNEFNGWEYYRSAKGGAYAGANFVVWNNPTRADVDVAFEAQTVAGCFINNSAYDVNSMNNGDSYAKKFGKDDYLLLSIIGFKDSIAQDTVEFYLAKEGKYVNEWTYVALSGLGMIDAVKFALSSSDNGAYGMNTPAYFCMDDFGAEVPEGYVVPEMAEFVIEEGITNTKAEIKATKMIRNGQVIIVRDGKMYNVMGAQL